MFDATGSVLDLEAGWTASVGRLGIGAGVQASRTFSRRRGARLHLASASLLFLLGTR